MTDLIAAALTQAEALTAAAVDAALAEGALSGEPPAAPKAVWGGACGDCSTAYPLAAARALGVPPRELAAALAARMALEGAFFASVEAGGPGFLNFRLSEGWYEAVLEAAEAAPPHPPAVPLSDREAIRLLTGARPGAPLEAELPLRRDRGNPLYVLRYAAERLSRLPEAFACVKEFPFSPAERPLIRSVAAYPAALRRLEENGDPSHVARCLTELTEALRRCRAACRAGGAPPHPRSLAAARRVLEDGMGVLGVL